MGPFCTTEQLLGWYDKLGVEKGVVLPLVSPEYYLPQSNDDVLEMAETYPDRFIPFCNVDPRSMTNSPEAPLGRLLRYYKDKGFRGIGEITANMPFQHPLVQNLFKHVEDVEFPLIFHLSTIQGGTYGLIDDPGLPQLEQSLQRFPRLRILGHATAFWAELGTLRKLEDREGCPDYPIDEEGAVVRLMREYDNLGGDLSAGSGFNALARDVDFAVRFLSEFQDRLFFGMDICNPNVSPKLPGFLTDLREQQKISEEVFRKISRDNALRLLKL